MLIAMVGSASEFNHIIDEFPAEERKKFKRIGQHTDCLGVQFVAVIRLYFPRKYHKAYQELYDHALTRIKK